jgi:Protein of unknown function (DUF1194)
VTYPPGKSIVCVLGGAFAKTGKTEEQMKIGTSCKVLASALLCASLLALPAESAPAPAGSGVRQVDLKLVIATDVSRSINDEEADIQREGMAEAFRSPEVIKAIQSGALGRIAVAMLDWSSPEFNRVVLDWTLIDGKASAEAFAEQIVKAPRTPGRRTSISGAIEMGALMLEASEKNIAATPRVIDVSGDGPNNDGRPLGDAHKEVMMQKVIINGLPIMDENANGYYPNLDKYFAGCVVGGTGAFVIVVRSFKDFGQAMRRKLILEISSDESQIKQVENELVRFSPVMKVQAGQNGTPERTEIIRPTQNEYSEQCDRNGFGFGGF